MTLKVTVQAEGWDARVVVVKPDGMRPTYRVDAGDTKTFTVYGADGIMVDPVMPELDLSKPSRPEIVDG